METKLNIAEILKDKPKGTKLYTDTFGELSIEDVYTGNEFGITLLCKDGDNLSFYNDGKYNEYGEPILVPSREMRDWSKFAWKRGDVLINDAGYKIFFDKWENDDYTRFFGSVKVHCYDTEDYTLASKEEAQEFIKSIEKTYGGKLNRETLEIEKAQPEFKDGDIVYADYGHKQAVFIVSGKTDLSEGYNSLIALDLRGLTLDMGYMSFFKEDLCKLRFATEEEKKQLFSALAKEGKVWIPEKKQIVDLKPKVELKPFDKVLVRDSKSDKWRVNLYGYKSSDGPYYCVYASWNYCIPYEGNEHLLGTTKNVKE